MKTRRLLTGLVAASMTVSICGCTPTKKTETEASTAKTSSNVTTSETTAETTPEPTASVTTASTTVPDTVVDESDEPILIYGYDQDLPELLKKYIPDQEYEYVYVKPEDYFAKLQTALDGDERVPDMFMMDKDHLQTWVYGGQTLSMDQLGISDSDLQDQFPYTYEAAMDSSHAIHALSYDLSPACVIYNRALAQHTLGSGDPADVAVCIENWNAILDSARNVNMNTEGSVKLFSGRDEIHDIFWAMHTEDWVQDGKVKVGGELEQYFLLQETLYAESLTSETERGSRAWRSNLVTNQAVMFFGSLNTAKDVIDYVPGHVEVPETEPTSADPSAETTTAIPEETGWGVLPAPNPTYDGGAWLMVAASTDKLATAAEVLRAVTLNEANLTKMALDGRFVNSMSIMEQCAEDPNFASDFLNGQNPYAVLVPEAKRISIPSDVEVNDCIDKEIRTLLQAYLDGDFLTMDEVKEQFVVGVEELLGLV